MSNEITKKMLAAYNSSGLVHNYFTRMCSTVLFDTEAVEFDIERDDEDVAIAITALESDARSNEVSQYTNKEFIPPVFKEKLNVNGFKLIKRQAGASVGDDIEFQGIANAQAMKGMQKIQAKIQRSVELMAAQVFQTGVVTCIDSAGTTLFSMDFQQNSALRPTVGTTWATVSADAPGDIGNLAEVILRRGKAAPTRLTFGKTAWRHFLNNTAVKSLLDKEVLNRGALTPPSELGGAVMHGTITIDGYVFELCTYPGFYKSPNGGTVTPYLADDKVVFSSPQSSVIAAFGSIPKVAPPSSDALMYLPPRVSGQGFDMTPSAWLSPNRDFLTVEAGTRPIVIPRGIDTFGCLDVVP